MLDPECNTNEQEAMNAKSSNLHHRNHRKRKKQYFNTIRHQMEFYFSDANLAKDRFLNKLLAVDPFVPLSTFMSFNKIKELTHSIEDIQKAIDGSEMLELSNDRQSVRRITEFRPKDNVDEVTVYVEALPPNSTHESVRNLFKQFGKVVYVSLPKFRTSGRIKEFAFVEFADKNSVEQCINAFHQFDGVIGDVSDPEKLKSVSAYVKEQEEIEEKTKSENEEDEEEDNMKVEIKAEAETEADTEVNNKVDDSNADPDSATESDVESISSIPTKRFKIGVDSPSLSETKENGDKNDDEEEEDVEKRKKRRQRQRKKGKPTAPTENEINAANDPGSNNNDEHARNNESAANTINVLRVATKVEWKRLRNKYLMLQREKYAEVKKLLRTQNRGAKKGKKVSTLPPMVRPVTMKTKQSPPPNKRICTRNINFYGAMGEDQTPANTYECSIIDENRATPTKSKGKKDEKLSAKESQFEFEPGLIVKVNFDQPCIDVADFKAEMKQYAFVRYVDIKEGQSNAFVRVDASRSAPILIKHCAPNRCQILTGESESEYWAKIAQDREQKLSKAVKVPRSRDRRMRNLIKNTAEVNVSKTEAKTTATHIRFCD